MTDAETILKMIETVDPSDNETLDHIDALVCLYVEPDLTPIKFYDGNRDKAIEHMMHFRDRPKYTRSLDAIETIMPKNVCTAQHFYEMTGYEDGKTNFCIVDGWDGYLSPNLPNEKLARLHAVIQYHMYKAKK